MPFAFLKKSMGVMIPLLIIVDLEKNMSSLQ